MLNLYTNGQGPKEYLKTYGFDKKGEIFRCSNRRIEKGRTEVKCPETRSKLNPFLLFRVSMTFG